MRGPGCGLRDVRYVHAARLRVVRVPVAASVPATGALMAFLAPLFFAGLVALAVPIIVHLTHKERKDVVVFPSLMFLSRIPYQAVRRQRIRHWLLFALRCLALILLALA